MLPGATSNGRDWQANGISPKAGLVFTAHGATMDEAEANATRILACVDYCTGAPNHDMLPRGLLATQRLLELSYSRRDDLARLNDELVSMLQQVIFAARDGAVLSRDSIHVQAMALLAKCGGAK